MRTIKFRGLRTDGMGWAYGNLINWHPTLKPRIVWFKQQGETSEELDFEETNYEVIPETVGQFTGLKDRNGKDVYEGDLISDGEKEPMILPVIYSDEYAMFCVDISYNKDGGSIEEILTCYEDGFTVVGNIHESPELLNN